MDNSVPLLDLKSQYAEIKDEINAAIQSVCDTQHFILGPEVEALEKEIGRYTQCRYAVGVSSGTDALLMSLMCLGIGPGDEVITTPYTFFSTAGCIARVGAKPVFVDIDPHTYNIDVSKIGEKVTSKARAIIPVHLYGQMADLHKLVVVADKYNLYIIEDAAQAIGAEIGGKRAGSISTCGCFSFFPSKNLGAFGDGGIVTTNDSKVADRLQKCRVHGMAPKYYHHFIGGNFRLDALQAAIVRVKLRHLDRWTLQRQENADAYRELFTQAGLLTEGKVICLPAKPSHVRHVYNQFVIRVNRRDELQVHLKANNIGCEVYYPRPLHQQECFSKLGYKEGDFPESEKASKETLAIPIYPELTRQQLERVVGCISEFYT